MSDSITIELGAEEVAVLLLLGHLISGSKDSIRVHYSSIIAKIQEKTGFNKFEGAGLSSGAIVLNKANELFDRVIPNVRRRILEKNASNNNTGNQNDLVKRLIAERKLEKVLLKLREIRVSGGSVSRILASEAIAELEKG